MRVPPLLDRYQQRVASGYWRHVHGLDKDGPLVTWAPRSDASDFEWCVWNLMLASSCWPDPHPLVCQALKVDALRYEEAVAGVLELARQMGGTALDWPRFYEGPFELSTHRTWLPPAWDGSEGVERCYGPRCTYTTFEPGDHRLAFTVEECDEIVAGLGCSEPNTDDFHGPDNREIADTEKVADRITSVMAAANDAWWHRTWRAPTPFHINDYGPGQEFTWHRDNAAFAADWTLSAVVVLNDPSEWEGGELQILERHDTITVPVQKGTVVVFESTLPHRVTPITAGRRVTLAAFWISHLLDLRLPLGEAPQDDPTIILGGATT